jgi:hypothetical protein
MSLARSRWLLLSGELARNLLVSLGRLAGDLTTLHVVHPAEGY